MFMVLPRWVLDDLLEIIGRMNTPTNSRYTQDGRVQFPWIFFEIEQFGR